MHSSYKLQIISKSFLIQDEEVIFLLFKFLLVPKLHYWLVLKRNYKKFHDFHTKKSKREMIFPCKLLRNIICWAMDKWQYADYRFKICRFKSRSRHGCLQLFTIGFKTSSRSTHPYFRK